MSTEKYTCAGSVVLLFYSSVILSHMELLSRMNYCHCESVTVVPCVTIVTCVTVVPCVTVVLCIELLSHMNYCHCESVTVVPCVTVVTCVTVVPCVTVARAKLKCRAWGQG